MTLFIVMGLFLLTTHFDVTLSWNEIGTLRFVVPAHGNRCFYEHIEKDGGEVHWEFLVESGDNYDIGYSFQSPNEQRIHQRLIHFDDNIGRRAINQSEKISYKNLAPGVYTVCFDNVMATKSDKVVLFSDDFDWLEEQHEREELKEYWKDKGRYAQSEQMDELVKLTKDLLKKLDKAEKQQNYLKTRMRRHFHTMDSTESRLNSTISFQVMLICIGLVVEVLWIKGWFKNKFRSFRV